MKTSAAAAGALVTALLSAGGQAGGVASVGATSIEARGSPKSNGRWGGGAAAGSRESRVDMSGVAPGRLKGESSVAVTPGAGRRRRIFHRVDVPRKNGNAGGRSSSEKSNPGREYFYGESDDGDGSTINLMACGASGNEHVCGSMNDVTEGYVYNFRHDEFGDPFVVEMPIRSYPPDGEPLSDDDDSGGGDGDGDGDGDGEGGTEESAKPDRRHRLRGLQTSEDPIMDVMVIWTPRAECRISGAVLGVDCTRNAATRQNAIDEIELAIHETNTAYANSGINAQLRLVHAYCEEGYDESDLSTSSGGTYGNAFSASLPRMRSSTDGYMDDIHPSGNNTGLRARYNADMVAMILDDGTYCGMAYLPYGSLENRQSSMYSATSWNCMTGYYTFGHELGHNQGCRHDRGTSGACSETDTNGYYGYRHPESRWRTMLAYTCTAGECDDVPGGGCSRIQRFSSANVTYNGDPTGSPGGPGTIGKIDNAGQINEAAGIIEDYYDACEGDGDCDDQDPCTANVCDGGVCAFGPLCDDGDGCTIDSCDGGVCHYEPRICANASVACVNGTCPGGAACMSGETGVFDGGTGSVRAARELHVGEVIRGLDGERRPSEECVVEAVGRFGAGPVVGNYTRDHFVMDADGEGVVMQGEAAGGAAEAMADKYAVLTSCPVGVDESGVGFTALASDYFDMGIGGSHSGSGGIPWSDYLVLHAAILQLVRESGTFWFSPSTYESMEEVATYTPALYRTMVDCATDPDGSYCDEFERAATDLIENTVTTEGRRRAKRAFPRLGRSREAGSAAAVVSRGRSIKPKANGQDGNGRNENGPPCPAPPTIGECSHSCHCPDDSFCRGNGYCK